MPRLLLPLIAVLWCSLSFASAATQTAAERIEVLIDQVTQALDELREEERLGDRAAINQLIERDILPAVDQERLARRVFRQYWSEVESAQRQSDAIEGVMDSLTRTYALALANYDGQRIELVDTRERGSMTLARTRIQRERSSPVQVDFALIQSEDGEWHIADMAIDGVVVSSTLHNSVRSVWQNQGMDEALSSLGSMTARADDE